MARSTKRKSTGSRGGSGNENLLWSLALILFIGLIGTWIWWSSKQTDKETGTTSRTNKTSKTTSPAKTTNVVVDLTPVVRTTAVTEISKTVTNSNAPTPATTNASLSVTPLPRLYPRPPRDILESQIALARFAISAGSIDGSIGSQTRAAIAAWQSKEGLTASGELDSATRDRLSLQSAPLTNYVITTNDLARLQPIGKTWLAKSQQSALDFETILELVAERGHASPNLIRRLNPKVNWTNVVAGTEVVLPNAEYPNSPPKAAFIVISLAKRQMEAFDARTNLLAHFPCSIAARFDKRPVGELHVTAIAPNPDYTFNPEVFPESAEAKKLPGKLILPPGPNNPVGTAWVSLDKPGYGMHGTPGPEQVGRTESHGCFRLANWNADYLIKLVSIGMPVRVMP